MSKGIKITKPGIPVSSTDPSNIVVDSRQSGAMKIQEVLYVNIMPSEWQETYVGPGMFPSTYGRIRIPHTLGYPPAFIAYGWNPPSQFMSNPPTDADAYLLPYLGFSAYPMRVYTTSTEIVVENLEDVRSLDETYQGDDYVIVILFAENLDSSE